MEQVIERLKLCISMPLNGGEQTIVNIKDLENLLKRISRKRERM